MRRRLIPWRAWLGLFAARLHRRRSRWYWIVHEVHLAVYWWGRESRRWELMK